MTHYEWTGSTDPLDKTGIATLTYTDSEGCKRVAVVPLPSFGALQEIVNFSESTAMDHTRQIKRRLLEMAEELEI